LLFGTVDSWLVWKLTKGQKHITDVSNASRTLLFNIHTLKWDTELLQLFNIPISMLPDVVDSSGLLATSHASVFNYPIAITSLIGDQQSALFGQLCTKVGMVKCTYGTGCFMMINTGNTVVESSHKMLSTIAWRINGKTTYALEGSVFVGGAVIQWLRDKLEFFTEASDSMLLAEAASDNGGVYFVPALTGLGAPYWDPDARGTIFGITRGTTKAHLTRAALESIAFQVNDVLKAMSLDINSPISQLRVDGGAAANELLLQFQSDVSRVDVLKPTQLETTALGAAFLAALGAGVSDLDSLNKNWILEHDLKPTMSQDYVNSLISRWDEAITRTLGWGGTDVK
jgi:glycerol kinase